MHWRHRRYAIASIPTEFNQIKKKKKKKPKPDQAETSPAPLWPLSDGVLGRPVRHAIVVVTKVPVLHAMEFLLRASFHF
jgi:hypothetical protein